MDRRSFIGTSLGLVATNALGVKPTIDHLSSWDEIREQFALDPSWVHLGGMLFATNPKLVRDAIEKHRRGLDANPIHYLDDHRAMYTNRVRDAAAQYFDVSQGDIALVDSTTMGSGLVANGLSIESSQEIVHAWIHPGAIQAFRYRARRTGCDLRGVSLYERSQDVSLDEVLSKLRSSIRDNTRVFFATWVNSSDGVKLPIKAMSDEIASINRGRSRDKRVIFCVDGVHGLGIDNVTISSLGCDFFISGTHKWLFGPRGTGIVVSKPGSGDYVDPTIGTFSGTTSWGYTNTPGGFHAYEHVWALREAFQFLMSVGKQKIADRTHELSRRLKEGLKDKRGINLSTPMSDEFSAGINCFTMSGRSVNYVVSYLKSRKIIASPSPYSPSRVRLTPTIYNSEEDVDKALDVL